MSAQFNLSKRSLAYIFANYVMTDRTRLFSRSRHLGRVCGGVGRRIILVLIRARALRLLRAS